MVVVVGCVVAVAVVVSGVFVVTVVAGAPEVVVVWDVDGAVLAPSSPDPQAAATNNATVVNAIVRNCRAPLRVVCRVVPFTSLLLGLRRCGMAIADQGCLVSETSEFASTYPLSVAMTVPDAS